MAILGLGALTVVLDPGSVKSYDNEVEYAKARGQDLRGRKPHRCNDRLEDFIQVRGLHGLLGCCTSCPCDPVLKFLAVPTFMVTFVHAPASLLPERRLQQSGTSCRLPASCFGVSCPNQGEGYVIGFMSLSKPLIVSIMRYWFSHALGPMPSHSQEPADPYVLLGPWNPCYIDPSKREEARREAEQAKGVQLPR
jgi:hypothetical protein